MNFGDADASRAPTAALSASATAVATNAGVTFTAAATDPDGDALAYYWDFGDRTFGTNAATATKSWATAGDYRVRLTVSDQRGRTASASVIVRVGTTTRYRVSGRVTDDAGNPLADVRVHNGLTTTNANYRHAYTDADGTYTLTNVVAGTYTMGAGRAGWTVTGQSFANPVAASGDLAGLDFTAAEVLYAASGKVIAAGLPVAGAVVSDGARSATTDADGRYALGLPVGTATLSVVKPGMSFAPAAVLVNYAGVARDFAAKGPGTGVLREWWLGIGGSAVSNLTANAAYPNSPSGSTIVGEADGGLFKAPTDFANDYGTRMRGYYVAPSTGTYTFWIASDDASQLWLSTDTNPANRAKIAEVTSSTGAEEWTKFAGQKSVAVSLVGGRRYFVEALHKEGGVSDHLAVGADIPGGVSERSIPLHRVEPWGYPTVATPVVVSPNPVATGSPASLTVLGTDDGGEAALTYTWAVADGPAGAPVPAFGAANGTNAGRDLTATFAAAGSYTLRVTIRDGGGRTNASTVDLVVADPPRPTAGAVVNGGAVQRSRVADVTVTFSEPVVPDAGAFAVAGRNGAGAGTTVSSSNPSGDGRTWVLTFGGTPVVAGSLSDGIYDLTVVAANVRAGSPTGPTMAADYAVVLHRLFGDADGDRDVDGADSRGFRTTLGSGPGSSVVYNPIFDHDADGDVDGADSRQFRSRLGTNL